MTSAGHEKSNTSFLAAAPYATLPVRGSVHE
jgi:hypothetical protein